MIKALFIFLVSLLLFFVSYVTYAAEDSTDINIDYTHVEYLNFIGSAVGASRYYSVDDVRPLVNTGPPSGRVGATLNIGTLGLESNIAGDCTLDFSSQNDFELHHTVSGQSLTQYRLDYRGTEITSGSNLQMILPCNTAASDIDFTAFGNFRRNPRSGVYQDIVNIVVTSQ